MSLETRSHVEMGLASSKFSITSKGGQGRSWAWDDGGPELTPKKTVLAAVAAMAVPILIPLVQFGVVYRLWDDYVYDVSQEDCINTCWDTVFKGPYESGASGYKHFYFNSNWTTLKIWILVVVGIVGIYEVVKQCILLAASGRARPKMLLLLMSVLYAHYYGWWGYLNYYNDDFYNQFWHQMFFTVTELISTITVFNLVDRRNPVKPRKVLTVVGIAALHILCSGLDQFIANVFMKQGELHQILRDLGLMAPDLLHLILPWLDLREENQTRGLAANHHVKRVDLGICVACVLFLSYVCSKIPP